MTYSRILTAQRGLSSAVKLAIYRQVIRPDSICVLDMFRIIVEPNGEDEEGWKANLRCKKDERGHYTSPSCEVIYKTSGVKRVDAWMVEVAIESLTKGKENENKLVQGWKITQVEFEGMIASNGALIPMCLLQLNRLYDSDKNLKFYHRRNGSYDIQNNVYNTTQWIKFIFIYYFCYFLFVLCCFLVVSLVC